MTEDLLIHTPGQAALALGISPRALVVILRKHRYPFTELAPAVGRAIAAAVVGA